MKFRSRVIAESFPLSATISFAIAASCLHRFDSLRCFLSAPFRFFLACSMCFTKGQHIIFNGALMELEKLVLESAVGQQATRLRR